MKVHPILVDILKGRRNPLVTTPNPERVGYKSELERAKRRAFYSQIYANIVHDRKPS